jgi:hypothetical protein
MIGVVVALMVTIIIGVLVWYKINTAMYAAIVVTGTSQTAINATWSTVNTTANTIWTLFPIVAIVIIAGIILIIVTNFGRGSGA